MRNKKEQKGRYDSISSETLQEFDREWDYHENPHPTAADYMIWLVRKSYDSEAEEATAKILESLGEDGTENEKAMKELQDIENRKKILEDTVKTIMADDNKNSFPLDQTQPIEWNTGQALLYSASQAAPNLYQQVASLARQARQTQSIEDRIQEVTKNLNTIQAALSVRA